MKLHLLFQFIAKSLPPKEKPEPAQKAKYRCHHQSSKRKFIVPARTWQASNMSDRRKQATKRAAGAIA
jgi:hypothetical protein